MNERDTARMCESGTERLETSARPAWLWDPARQRIVWANAAAVTLFGEDGLLSLAERPFDVREPGVAALSAVLPAVNEAGEKGLALKLAFPSAGIKTPVDVRVRAHALPDGREGLLVVACAPAMENSPRFGHMLREVLEAMPLAVAVVDEAARLVYANPAALTLVGEDRLGGLRAFFTEEGAARAFLKRAAEAGLSHASCELAVETGGHRRLRITARPSGEEGGIALFTLVIEDITERSRLEKAMERQIWPPLPQMPTVRPAHPEAAQKVSDARTTVATPPFQNTLEKATETGSGVASRADRSTDALAQPAKRGERLPLSEEDIRTFHRLSGQKAVEATESPVPNAEDFVTEVPHQGEKDANQKTVNGVSNADDAAVAKEISSPSPSPTKETAPNETQVAAKSGNRISLRDEGNIADAAGAKPARDKDGHVEEAPSHVSNDAVQELEKDMPEVPALVRNVLDHRPEPILLHRDMSFLYANKAAREAFGRALADGGWNSIIESLADTADGDVTRLTDAEGHTVTYRVNRDVFPWRDGAVVQTTLSPLPGETPEDGKSKDGAVPAESPTVSQTAATDKADSNSDEHRTDTPRSDGSHAEEKGSHESRTMARSVGGRVRIISATTSERERATLPAKNEGGSSARETIEGSARVKTNPEVTCAQAEPLDEELRAILDTATDGIITLNRDGEILSFSAGAEALFGLRTADVVGRPFVELLEGDSRKVVEDYMQALAGGNSLAGIYNEGREVTARVAGGGQIPLFITIGKLGRNGEAERPPNKAAFCVVVRDITQWKKTESELRRAKEEAERSSAMKSEFLAAISHELRTPLNAILGFSDVMRNERFGAIGNEKYKGYANDIYQSGEHLLSLINDLLDLSRIEAGKFELNFEDVDVAAVAEETLNLMKEEAAKEKVILRRAIAADLPRVVADARSLKQILLNLLSNAVKFTESGGQVVLAARMTDKGELEISVSDTGMGMTEEELERALKPFERITGKGRPEKPGTGLGLPLTKALAEANHARFEMESEPGKGTTVRIIFPTQRVLA